MSATNPTMTRRTALAALGSAGLGLWAMQWPQGHAGDLKADEFSKLLPSFSEPSRHRIRHLLQDPSFSGHIPASDVKALADNEGKTIDALMLDLLPLARTYSRPPISNFHVGAVARGASGNLYFGANLEFPGHSLGFSVHGEQSALSNAYMHADAGVAAIAVTHPPCGHCRQFMQELSPEGDLDILVEGSRVTKLSVLLPQAFGPRNLDFKDGAFPVKEANFAGPKGATDQLTVAALDAARKSYAPHTKSYSGVAIGTRSGRVYKGSYIENAAYNPSLSPLQTALVALILAGESNSSIAKVTLVEVEGAPISQKSVAEAVLGAIAPAVKLQIVRVAMQA